MSGTTKAKHLLVMAAGTGGHIFPGLAIADEMQQRGWTVSWLGTKTGMEADIVAKHGIAMDQLDFTGLRGKGLNHSITGGFKLIASFFACFGVMRRRQPSVVLGMGGYITVPGGISAALSGRPVVLMNADAPLLLSNKALKPFAKKLMFGLPSSEQDRAQDEAKEIFTGNPIRRDITNLPEPAKRYAERTGPLRILVVGGSLGAKALNECVPQAWAAMPLEQRPILTHQSGKQHVEGLRQRYAELGVEAEVVDFIHDMPRRYAEVDLVICRAGAITVSELTAAGVASVLVPLVASSTSHQRANAQWLSKEGGAIHMPQSEMTAEKLAQLVLTMKREQCLAMANAAYVQGRRQAVDTIAKILEDLAI
ncbi:undecaprenyldiphospho-muramoylpentapeptide beta-N-acetylglucosaminyltransferase [Undibacterium cyanobacteriorum]|uniref:UDP-N-acetylglucosamine--N-acetylmuramyl-(pentapeptide) pyrophosphoryl-undecaprenol N-acetylglucosamine transferase n=1 Tax=Undibacterium cyanobacteriorum TaxID=3073561 RepID=A0ABY9RGH9_9BURK|nr:undecaprenyldiphospho-muramoylpentapeptide beta-N-acetylglucosaminyltransferase [Undibacterium sp. 20NA77.5]WMW79969.1 undecaprenyldiphospho-muramoylpentapeptide beta-N-acetylglucosaminyltransferase [Undibacterium sp. 20NA77.5]